MSAFEKQPCIQVRHSGQRRSTFTSSSPWGSHRRGCRRSDPQLGHTLRAATRRTYGRARTERPQWRLSRQRHLHRRRRRRVAATAPSSRTRDHEPDDPAHDHRHGHRRLALGLPALPRRLGPDGPVRWRAISRWTWPAPRTPGARWDGSCPALQVGRLAADIAAAGPARAQRAMAPHFRALGSMVPRAAMQSSTPARPNVARAVELLAALKVERARDPRAPPRRTRNEPRGGATRADESSTGERRAPGELRARKRRLPATRGRVSRRVTMPTADVSRFRVSGPRNRRYPRCPPWRRIRARKGPERRPRAKFRPCLALVGMTCP
jgi:hypothetical protein